MQHERGTRNCVVHKYDADLLGAPFKVTLVDSVSFHIDKATGEELVRIPDLMGLINAVVRKRVCDPRKLNGDELKFIRRALGVKAVALARFLGMSPEHLSRCEASAKAMSEASEKIFRLFSFIVTRVGNADVLLEKSTAPKVARKTASRELSKEVDDQSSEGKKAGEEFMQFFLSMKICPIFKTNEVLHYEFRRCLLPDDHCDDDLSADGKWAELPSLEEAA